MKAGFSIKLILYFAPNCPQQIVAPNCPTPNCPRRIVRAELSAPNCPAPNCPDTLICGLRTVYLINLKNFICVDIVKCQVKFCLLGLLDFLHIKLFLTDLANTGGPHEISRRAACGPWAAGWTALAYNIT